MMDFKVKYKFLSESEGGRKTLPTQCYRSDFWYEHPDNKHNSLFIIHPFFEDADGNLLPDGVMAPKEGIAQMVILNPIMRDYHMDRIKTGMKCYFMEGKRKVAECEIIKI